MTPDRLLVHFHEIALKGRNRGVFLKALRRNLTTALGDQAGEVRSLGDRLEVRDPGDGALERTLRVFGVANAAPVRAVEATPTVVLDTALEVAEATDADEPFETFAVRARRARTRFPLDSGTVNVEVGEAIRTGLDKAVDLSSPDVTIRIEIVGDTAYVSARKFTGAGGLPVGTAGRTVALLSAGIDSPVAVWRMLKRGSDVVAVHCHGQPFTDPSSERNVSRILDQLGRWGFRGTWWSVPIGEEQRAITLGAPARVRVLLYRRLMLRVAEALAEREDALGIVTGESLAQVASQTLENLGAVGAVATLPVLRPLIGHDKAEIIDEARRIGTYDLSVLPHQDCCTLFEPREAATRTTADALARAEADLDVDGALRRSLERARRVGPDGDVVGPDRPTGTVSP
ncbi:MAG: tRNA uracil 4-sulfurtransferase ThiI [Acidimicrobiia bacterium]